MAEFRVVIEGLELDAAATQELNDSIQRAVLEHLAGHDITGGPEPKAVIAFRPRPGWYGMVARLVAQKELEQLPGMQHFNENLR